MRHKRHHANSSNKRKGAGHGVIPAPLETLEVLLSWLVLTHLTQPRVIWRRKASVEKRPTTWLDCGQAFSYFSELVISVGEPGLLSVVPIPEGSPGMHKQSGWAFWKQAGNSTPPWPGFSSCPQVVCYPTSLSEEVWPKSCKLKQTLSSPTWFWSQDLSQQ